MTIQLSQKKILLGNPAHANHLSPMLHQWAWDMSNDSFNNFWKHEEVSMSPDIASFRSLSENEKTAYINTVSTLSSMDLVIGRNVAVSIYPHITCPEIESFLDSQIMLEGIHKKAYHVMLQGVGLDEEFVYSRYLEVPEIAAKFAFMKQFTDRLELRRGNFMTDEDYIKNVLECLAAWYIVAEYLWFYTGFAQIYAFANNNKMTASAEQVRYIQRDEEQHGKFGLRLLQEIQKETGVYLQKPWLKELLQKAVKLEQNAAQVCTTYVPGFTTESYCKQVEFVAYQRLRQMGLSEEELISTEFNRQNVLPWLDTQTGAIKKEQNFFETRVTEYTKAALSFEDSSEHEDPLKIFTNGSLK